MFRKDLWRKIIASLLSFAFLSTNGIVSVGNAQEFIGPSSPTISQPVSLTSSFNPPLLKGVKVYADNPFKLDFILDKGEEDKSRGDAMRRPDKGRVTDSSLQDDAKRLIKYFLASVTVPEQDLWVNLSPYEKDRIIPDAFGVTEMGRDLLAQDYILKQITASLMNPEGEVGREFWDKLYERLTDEGRRLKDENGFQPLTLNLQSFLSKVWIVPDKAVVYESKDGAYVVESRMKVMLQSEALQTTDHRLQTTDFEGSLEKRPSKESVVSSLQSEVLSKIIIPVLEQEINNGKNFAQLRQVYNSLILAVWYKNKIKESILGKSYVDKNKTGGVEINDKNEKEKIWSQYVETFKKGAYDFIKEEYDPNTQQIVPKKYFSGGMGMENIRSVIQSADRAQLPQSVLSNTMIVETNLRNSAGEFRHSRKIDPNMFSDFYPGAEISNFRTMGDSDVIDSTLQIGSVEVGAQFTWVSKSPHNLLVPQYVIQLRKLADTVFRYKPNQMIPFDIYVAPLSEIEAWDDEEVSQQDHYKGYVFLSFDEKGCLIKPKAGWKIFGPESLRSGYEWSFDFIFKQIDLIVGRPFSTGKLKDTEDFLVTPSIPTRLSFRSSFPIKESGWINNVPYTIHWKNFSGKPYKGTSDEKNDIIHKIKQFVGSEDSYESFEKKLGFNLPYNELGGIDIQYLRFSQRIVFLITFHPKDIHSQYRPISLIAKRGQNDSKNVLAFKALKGTGLVPEFVGEIDNIYYEQNVHGSSVLSIGEQRALTYDEIRFLAATWVRVGSKLEEAGLERPFVMDMNPGNIVKKENTGKRTDFVVVDIYGAPKKPYNQYVYFIQEFYDFYVTKKILNHTPATSQPIQAMLEGIAEGLDDNIDQINDFFIPVLNGYSKEIEPVLHQEIIKFLKTLNGHANHLVAKTFDYAQLLPNPQGNQDDDLYSLKWLTERRKSEHYEYPHGPKVTMEKALGHYAELDALGVEIADETYLAKLREMFWVAKNSGITDEKQFLNYDQQLEHLKQLKQQGNHIQNSFLLLRFPDKDEMRIWAKQKQEISISKSRSSGDIFIWRGETETAVNVFAQELEMAQDLDVKLHNHPGLRIPFPSYYYQTDHEGNADDWGDIVHETSAKLQGIVAQEGVLFFDANDLNKKLKIHHNREKFQSLFSKFSEIYFETEKGNQSARDFFLRSDVIEILASFELLGLKVKYFDFSDDWNSLDEIIRKFPADEAMLHVESSESNHGAQETGEVTRINSDRAVMNNSFKNSSAIANNVSISAEKVALILKDREMELSDYRRPGPEIVKNLSWDDIFAGAYLAFNEMPDIDQRIKQIFYSKMWKELNNALPYVDQFVDGLLQKYPGYTIIAAGRDGEIFYDAISQKSPSTKVKLIHAGHFIFKDIHRKLYAASLRNQPNPVINKFLEEAGLTLNTIQNEKFLLVDTGFSGSVGEKVQNLVWSIFPNVDFHFKSILLAGWDPKLNPGNRYAKPLFLFNTSHEILAHDFLRSYSLIPHEYIQNVTPYRTNFTVATALQLLPRYHGHSKYAVLENGRLKIIFDQPPLNWDMDTIDSRGFDGDIVNPLAALMVQKRTLEYFAVKKETGSRFVRGVDDPDAAMTEISNSKIVFKGIHDILPQDLLEPKGKEIYKSDSFWNGYFTLKKMQAVINDDEEADLLFWLINLLMENSGAYDALSEGFVRLASFESRSGKPVWKIDISQGQVEPTDWHSIETNALMIMTTNDLSFLEDSKARQQVHALHNLGKGFTFFARFASLGRPVRLEFNKNNEGGMTTTLLVEVDHDVSPLSNAHLQEQQGTLSKVDLTMNALTEYHPSAVQPNSGQNFHDRAMNGRNSDSDQPNSISWQKWQNIEEIELPNAEEDQIRILHLMSLSKWSTMSKIALRSFKSLVMDAREEFSQYLTDDIIKNALKNLDGVMELIRRSHPYTLQVLRNPDQFTHRFPFHEGMYYYLFAMKLLEKTSTKPSLILNFDPHEDFVKGGLFPDEVITAGGKNGEDLLKIEGVYHANWASAAVRDGLAEMSISANRTQNGWVYYCVRKNEAGDLIHELISNVPNDYRTLNEYIRKYFPIYELYLTVDLDSFSGLHMEAIGQGKETLHLNNMEVASRMNEILNIVQQLEARPQALITADSKSHLASEADDDWLDSTHEIVRTIIESAFPSNKTSEYEKDDAFVRDNKKNEFPARVMQRAQALRETIAQIRRELPNSPIYFENTVDEKGLIPEKELVANPMQELLSPEESDLYGDLENRAAYLANQYDVRIEFLRLIRDYELGLIKNLEDFKDRLIKMHTVLLLGSDGDSLYIPNHFYDGTSDRVELKRKLLYIASDCKKSNYHFKIIYKDFQKLMEYFQTNSTINLEDFVSDLSLFYSNFMGHWQTSRHVFQYGNNSMAMNMLNVFLSMANFKGISHKNYDVISMVGAMKVMGSFSDIDFKKVRENERVKFFPGIPIFLRNHLLEDIKAVNGISGDAMNEDVNNGGIDFSSEKMKVDVKNNGNGIQFHFDQAMIEELQSSTGLEPVIINIKPMTITVPVFLGVSI